MIMQVTPAVFGSGGPDAQSESGIRSVHGLGHRIPRAVAAVQCRRHRIPCPVPVTVYLSLRADCDPDYHT